MHFQFIPVKRREEGSALMAVIGVMAVTAVIAVTVASVVFSAAGYSTSTRAATQSRTAADAGVDAAYAYIKAKIALPTAYYPCSYKSTDIAGYSGPSFSTAITYKDAAGGALGCTTGALTGAPATAEILSTGSSQQTGIGNSSGNSVRVNATLTVTPPTPATSAYSLTHTVFTSNDVTIKNGSVLHESVAGAGNADIYSNGSVTCDSGTETVQGSVIAKVDIKPTNNCYVSGDLWAGGNISTQGGSVAGSVYQAGTGTVSFTNSGTHVGGSIVANGGITLNSAATACASGPNATVCGSLIGLGGSVSLVNGGTTVGGDVYAKGAVSVADGAKVYGSVWATNGDATINGVVVGNVYASGAVTMESNGRVTGSVYAYGGGATIKGNITQDLYAKGSINMTDPPAHRIGRNVVSTTGGISMTNANSRPVVDGFIQVATTVNPLATAVAGNAASSCQGSAASSPFVTKCSALSMSSMPGFTPAATFRATVGYPTVATVQKPPAEALPIAVASVTASDISLWTSAGYSYVTKSGAANSGGSGRIEAHDYLVNGTAGATKTVVVVTNCSGPLSFPSESIRAYADLAIIDPCGFFFQNSNNTYGVVGDSAADRRNVSFIVPTGATGNFLSQGIKFTNVNTFIYSPNTVEFSNAVTGFYGQIYAGTLTGPGSGSVMTMQQMNVPGIKDPSGAAATPGTPADATLLSRLLVSG